MYFFGKQLLHNEILFIFLLLKIRSFIVTHVLKPMNKSHSFGLYVKMETSAMLKTKE